MVVYLSGQGGLGNPTDGSQVDRENYTKAYQEVRKARFHIADDAKQIIDGPMTPCRCQVAGYHRGKRRQKPLFRIVRVR